MSERCEIERNDSVKKNERTKKEFHKYKHECEQQQRCMCGWFLMYCESQVRPRERWTRLTDLYLASHAVSEEAKQVHCSELSFLFFPHFFTLLLSFVVIIFIIQIQSRWSKDEKWAAAAAIRNYHVGFNSLYIYIYLLYVYHACTYYWFKLFSPFVPFRIALFIDAFLASLTLYSS